MAALPLERSRILLNTRRLLALALLATTAFAQAPTAANAADAALDRELKRVSDVYALVETHAADPVDPDRAIYQGAIPGLLRKLDPHSVFFDPNQFEQLKQMERSTSKGFGSIVSVLPGRVIVLQTMSGTPSARSGISPGDEIVAINNIRLDRLEIEQLVQLLTESKQRPAQLYVHRPGTPKLLQFTLIPEEMQSKSVDRAFLLRNGIGYVRIASFEEKTSSQLQEAIEQLGGSKLQGLVLDLRNNPGGFVTAALRISSFFLNPGQKILTVRGRKVAEQAETVPPSAKPYKFRMAVLLNEKSASASEIVAGALQDHDRATIIGVPSFGKGLVESVYPLSENTGLALTTALYYTPSGRSIQKPLRGGDFALSATASHPNEQATFKTDKGRTVLGGGGITPDFIVDSASVTRLRAALEASGAFTSFATEYVRSNKVDEKFEITPALLDQFQVFCADRRIQPGVAEWSRERDFITNRLKSEIFNQALGVEKGDEVELQADPQVRKALEVVVAN